MMACACVHVHTSVHDGYECDMMYASMLYACYVYEYSSSSAPIVDRSGIQSLLSSSPDLRVLTINEDAAQHLLVDDITIGHYYYYYRPITILSSHKFASINNARRRAHILVS